MAKNKKRASHTESADEVIHAITEVLLCAEGETIENVANNVGLNVKYEGDSIFTVYEE